MLYLVRRCIRRSPKLYQIIRRIQKKERLYPNAGTTLCIEGYQRSGNTCAYYIAKELMGAPQLISSHYHNIAALKSSMSLKIPTVVLLREPAAAVASLVQMDGVEEVPRLIRRRLKEWVDFYDFVKSNASELHIYGFDSLIKDSLNFALFLRDLTGVETDGPGVQICVKRAESKLKANEATKPISGSSLPVEERRLSKQRILDLIYTLPEYGEAAGLKADLESLQVRAQMSSVVENL